MATSSTTNFPLSSPHKPINSLNFTPNTRRQPFVFPAKSCLNLPLPVRSPAGRSLSSVLQNDPLLFYDAVSSQLNRIGRDRDAAFARLRLSLGSSEASLHSKELRPVCDNNNQPLLICEVFDDENVDDENALGIGDVQSARRIAKMKEAECQLEVEDVLYMIILYKFSEIRVPMVPSLSKCLYNSRLEIIPSKDWELESIHNAEFLEMVREYMTVAFGWKPNSSVTVNWSMLKVPRLHLSRVYARSILYGYFLKSASLRFQLEHNLPQTYQNAPFGDWTPLSSGFKNAVLGEMVTSRSTALSQLSRRHEKVDAKLRSYVTGFDSETKEVCAKLKSDEAFTLIDKHCSALFGGYKVNDSVNDEMILTSLSSLKRLVLEAVAFGCFLWDAEQCVNNVYKLNDE